MRVFAFLLALAGIMLLVGCEAKFDDGELVWDPPETKSVSFDPGPRKLTIVTGPHDCGIDPDGTAWYTDASGTATAYFDPGHIDEGVSRIDGKAVFTVTDIRWDSTGWYYTINDRSMIDFTIVVWKDDHEEWSTWRWTPSGGTTERTVGPQTCTLISRFVQFRTPKSWECTN